MRAIAIDDEPLPLEVLESYCSRTDQVSLVAVFTEIGQAQQYLKEHEVDLLFLDIHMPRLSGIEFYKSVSDKTMVIFTTAHSQYAVEGFNLNAVDYLLKPFSFKRFETAVLRAYDQYRYNNQPDEPVKGQLMVYESYSLKPIPFDKIRYIESFGDYVHIHQTGGDKVTTKMTLKAVQAKLPENDFIRIHRSYVIPLSQITAVRNKQVYIGETPLSIGSTYEEEFFRLFGG